MTNMLTEIAADRIDDHPIDAVTVVDCIGQDMALGDCTILCAKVGENDYTDPLALILEDGVTIVGLEGDCAPTFFAKS